MTKDEELIERAANIAYRVCAETRHVTLGDKAANAIRAELRPADRLEALAQPVVGVAGLIERQAVVAWLRHQSDLGANRGNDALEGSTKRAAFGGGSLALSRVADAIEEGEHRTNDNAALAASPAPVVGDREAIADSLKHCKALILSTGREISIADGKITLPGDLTDVERAELRGILSLSTPVVGGEADAIAELHRIVEGIDRTELEDDKGWWSTSPGEEFGADILAKLERLVMRLSTAAPDPHTTDRAGMAQEVE